MAIINGHNPEVWADELMESLKENLQMNSFQQGKPPGRAAQRKMKLKKASSSHSSLVGSHGTRSIPLADEHDSSTLRRWLRWSGVHPPRHPRGWTVGLQLISSPAADEEENISAAQVAMSHKQMQRAVTALASKNLAEAIDKDVMEKIYRDMIDKTFEKANPSLVYPHKG